MNADTLLEASVAFKNATKRTEPLQDSFATVDEAFETMKSVLMHEAKEEVERSSKEIPERLRFYSVDVGSATPGVFEDEETVVKRPLADISPLQYEPTALAGLKRAQGRHVAPPTFTRTPDEAVREASGRLDAMRAEEEKGSKRERAAERRAKKLGEESEGDRQARLQKAKEKRAERKRKKEAEGEAPEEPSDPAPEATAPAPAAPAAPAADEPDDPESLVVPSARPHLLSRKTKVPKNLKGEDFDFVNVAPAHRHLYGLTRASCPSSAPLVQALLAGKDCPSLLIVDGPPGTGKTTQLVQLVPEHGRVLMAAPSNVAAANMYEKMVAAGHGDSVSLCMPPQRVPAGVAVLSNDPSRRIVCATISGRNGPSLDFEEFEHLMLDEAAMTSEALFWTLVREEVRTVTLAGDVRQLPALVSDSGARLDHQRSLMERLLALDYQNVLRLQEQHRMAPELLAYPNAAFYGGALRCGQGAPARGGVAWHVAPKGREEASGSSFFNVDEAQVALRLAKACESEAVVLVPYAAQLREVAARGGGVDVQTLDSFQGREADVVILCLVRDGSAGFGFWSDARRLTVALTRARRELHVVSSPDAKGWPASEPLGAFAKRFYTEPPPPKATPTRKRSA
jgi:hypothetical protein